MKERLIKWLGGYTHIEYTLQAIELSAKKELLDRANALLDKMPPYCSVTEGCVMQDGHLGGCRDISGLCFSTLHAKELKRQRQERETANVL